VKLAGYEVFKSRFLKSDYISWARGTEKRECRVMVWKFLRKMKFRIRIRQAKR
jgi:hypothetical protein